MQLTQAGREIRQQQLSVPATLGANMQGAATVEVAVDNGDDTPLPITAVRLEMRQRKLCFAAPTAQPVTLFYGDDGAARAAVRLCASLLRRPRDTNARSWALSN